MGPRVAIITPTYQHARFIEACVRSVFEQTEQDWEMVIVDDGSTDGTADLAERNQDPRIQVIRNSHRGLLRLGEAYSAALAVTSAPLVAVLEGDDTWPNYKLARQIPLFANPDVVLSYGAAELIDKDGVCYARYDRHPGSTAKDNYPLTSILPHLVPNNFVVSATVIVRRSALDGIGGFWQPQGVPYVDHPTWLRLALEGRFAHCPFVVGRWRRHPAQYTTEFAGEVATDATAYVGQVIGLAASRGFSSSDRFLTGSQAARERRAFQAEVGAGRLQLLAGDWSAAGSTFKRLTSRSQRSSALIVGLLGWVSSWLHRDLEWLFRVSGRLSWPPRR